MNGYELWRRHWVKDAWQKSDESRAAKREKRRANRAARSREVNGSVAR